MGKRTQRALKAVSADEEPVTATRPKANHVAKELPFPSEELRWKFLACQRQLTAITDEVQRPVIEEVRAEFMRKLAERVQKICRNNPAWIRAKQARDEALEAIEKVTSEGMPEGYCLNRLEAEPQIQIDPETKAEKIVKEPFVQFAYLPDQVGKPLRERV